MEKIDPRTTFVEADNEKPQSQVCPLVPQRPQHFANFLQPRSWAFHIHTLWLFTASDIKSVIIPGTLLSLSAGLSGPLLTTNPSPTVPAVLARTPLIIMWNWLSLLLFCIDNQFQPHSILEDAVNKPWRALPSHRLSPREARRLLLGVIPTVFLATFRLGGIREAVTLKLLTWMYNYLGGADDGVVVRNLLNALGYMCYGSGSMVIAAGYGQHELAPRAYPWLAILGAIIFTTRQLQDMPDVHGDAARGRQTVPLLYGDSFARYSIAVPVVAWSLLCPAFWGSDLLGYAAPLVIGLFLGVRLLLRRSVAADADTWKVWCVWISVIYVLPVWKQHGAVVGEYVTLRRSSGHAAQTLWRHERGSGIWQLSLRICNSIVS
ncbi:hypothetical protein MMC26_000059 [Xylographa opegraphella]|nr:hypothetical protein [Xylographa opegraphella]